MIENFTGNYRFLSNFYPATVEYNGKRYPSVEHAYQAAKSNDPAVRELFQDYDLTTENAKKLGQTIELRQDWEDVKLTVMEDLVSDKFTRHKQLRLRLLDTADQQLIEGNWWGDKFWGVCDGEGENHLGKILMKIRQESEGD